MIPHKGVSVIKAGIIEVVLLSVIGGPHKPFVKKLLQVLLTHQIQKFRGVLPVSADDRAGKQKREKQDQRPPCPRSGAGHNDIRDHFKRPGHAEFCQGRDDHIKQCQQKDPRRQKKRRFAVIQCLFQFSSPFSSKNGSVLPLCYPAGIYSVTVHTLYLTIVKSDEI